MYTREEMHSTFRSTDQMRSWVQIYGPRYEKHGLTVGGWVGQSPSGSIFLVSRAFLSMGKGTVRVEPRQCSQKNSSQGWSHMLHMQRWYFPVLKTIGHCFLNMGSEMLSAFSMAMYTVNPQDFHPWNTVCIGSTSIRIKFGKTYYNLSCHMVFIIFIFLPATAS